MRHAYYYTNTRSNFCTMCTYIAKTLTHDDVTLTTPFFTPHGWQKGKRNSKGEKKRHEGKLQIVWCTILDGIDVFQDYQLLPNMQNQHFTHWEYGHAQCIHVLLSTKGLIIAWTKQTVNLPSLAQTWCTCNFSYLIGIHDILYMNRVCMIMYQTLHVLQL